MPISTIPTRQLDAAVMEESEALILLKGPNGQDGDVPVVDNVGNITWQTPTGIQAGDPLTLLVGPAAQAGAVPTIDALGVISWDSSVARQSEIGTRIPEFHISSSGNITAPGVYIVDTTSGVITLDMPNAATSGGSTYRFVLSTGGNDLVVTTVGGTDQIGPGTTKTLADIGDAFSCVDDGISKYEIFTEAAGGGFVGVSGIPSNNHIAVWIDASNIEGDANLVWDGSVLTVNGDYASSGVYERAIRTDQTLDASVTTLASFTLPDDSSYMVNVNVSGKRTDGANTGRLMYKLRAGVYRESAGVATLQGAEQTPTTKTGGGVGAWGATIDVTGNDFRVRVNGDTGHTVEWTAVVEMIKAF